jgi:hypothetical protein
MSVEATGARDFSSAEVKAALKYAEEVRARRAAAAESVEADTQVQPVPTQLLGADLLTGSNKPGKGDMCALFCDIMA